MKIFSNGVSKKMITELEEKVESHIANTKVGVMQVICNSEVASLTIPYPEGFNESNCRLLCYWHRDTDDIVGYYNEVGGYYEEGYYNCPLRIYTEEGRLCADVVTPDTVKTRLYLHGYINFYFVKI